MFATKMNGDIEIKKVYLEDYERIFPPKNFSRMPILYLEFLENKVKVKKELINKHYTPPDEPVSQTNEEINRISSIDTNELEEIDNDNVGESGTGLLEMQINSLLGEDSPSTGVPTLEELQQKKKITISQDYRYIEETEEMQQERNAVYFKYEVLRRMHPNANIPEFNMFSDPKIMAQKYEMLTRKLSLDSSVDNWKRYMIIFVMGCEVLLGKINFDMEGFAQQQIMSMSSYEQLLVEMAEKSYALKSDSKWPPEIRLLMMLTMNVVLFIVSKMIFKKTGTNLLGSINNITIPSEERKMKEPNNTKA